MKFKALISSLIFISACFYTANCQTFEFAKIVGDTNVPQLGNVIYQNANQDFVVGSVTGTAAKKNYKYIINKTDKGGNNIFSLISDTVVAVKPQIAISTNGDYVMYGAKVMPGSVKLSRFISDSLGKNHRTLNNLFTLKALDSAATTYPEIHVKYVLNECLYIYGQSPYAPNNSYVIWKIDTTGKLIWRQDYFDTCNGNSFNLTVFKNKLLLTSGIYNNVMSGARLLWLDTMGNVTKENTVSTPLFPPTSEINNSLVTLSDTSIVMGFYINDWANFAWPLIIKFNSNLDTIWHTHMKFSRLAVNINPSNDETSINKIVATVDDNIGIYWSQNFSDYGSNGTYADNLRTYKSDGTLLSKISTDSIYHFGLGSYTDMIATLDKGFALTGIGNFSVTKSGSYLLKLKGFVVTGIDEPIEIGGDITMYPNPSRNIVTITSTTQLEATNIYLYNIQGELVARPHPQPFSQGEGSSFVLYRNNLPSGLYLLKIQNNKGEQFLKKIIFE